MSFRGTKARGVRTTPIRRRAPIVAVPAAAPAAVPAAAPAAVPAAAPAAVPAAAIPRMTLLQYIAMIQALNQVGQAARAIAALDMDSFENQTLLAGNDTEHDMGKGYRCNKGDENPHAKDQFIEYYVRFLKKRYRAIISQGCRGNIDLLHYYSNCIQNLPIDRKITPSEVEMRTKAYFERSTTLSNKIMKKTITYRQIIDGFGVLPNGWGAYDIIEIVEGARDEYRELIQSPINRTLFAMFIETFLYGQIVFRDWFITFDASQDRINNIFNNHLYARRLLTPQNIADSANTTTEQLGVQNNAVYFPETEGGGIYRSPYHYFSEEHANTRYRNRGFALDTLGGFDYIINYHSGDINQEIVCPYGNGINQGPSLNYLLELHLLAFRSAIPQIAHNFTRVETQARQLNIGRIIGTHYAAVAQQMAIDARSDTPSALLLDIKRNGDYDQQKAAKIANANLNNRVDFSTGDTLSGLKCNTDGPENEKVNCMTQLAGSITLYKMKDNAAGRAAAAAARIQYNREKLEMYRIALIIITTPNGFTQCKQNIIDFMASLVVDRYIQLRTYTDYLQILRQMDIFIYLSRFMSVIFSADERTAIETNHATIVEQGDLLNEEADALRTVQIDMIKNKYLVNNFTTDTIESIITTFNNTAVFDPTMSYPCLNYEWVHYDNLFGMENVLDERIYKIAPPERPNSSEVRSVRQKKKRYIALDIDECLTPATRYNEMIGTIINTFQSQQTKNQLYAGNGKLNVTEFRGDIIPQLTNLRIQMIRRRSYLSDRNSYFMQIFIHEWTSVHDIIAPAAAAPAVAQVAQGGASKRSFKNTSVPEVNANKSFYISTNPFLQYRVLKQICNQAAVYVRGMIVDTEQPIITLFIISIELKHLINEMNRKNDGLVRYQAGVIKKRCEKFNLRIISDQMNKIVQHNGSWDKIMDELKGSITNLDHIIGQLYTDDMRNQIILNLVKESKTEPYSTTLKEMIKEMYLTWRLELYKNKEITDSILQYMEKTTDELSILRVFLVLGLLDDNLDGSIERRTSLLSDVCKYQPQRLQLSREIDNSSELLGQIMEQIKSNDIMFSKYMDQFNNPVATTNSNLSLSVPANQRTYLPPAVIAGGNRTRKHRGHKTQRKKHGARKTKSKRRFGTQRKKQNRK